MIYFVQAGEFGSIKIGYTNDLARRLGALQTGCPHPLTVLGVIDPGEPEMEMALHSKFSQHRSSGEWFAPTEEIVEYISQNAVPFKKPGREVKTQADRVLSKFPTIRALSREMGVGETTISMWRAREWIPSPYHQQILDAALRLGVELTPNDFFERPYNTRDSAQ